MRRTLLRFLTAAQLTRCTLAYGLIAELWLVLLITRADPGSAAPAAALPFWPALAAGLAVAVGLFAFGASLNDVVDARHDRTFSPDRPIPAGRIRPDQAAIVTSLCLVLASLGACAFGAPGVVMTAITALGIVFYTVFGRFVPSIGFVTIGLVHATHMLIPNPAFAFTPPVWLSMTHATAIAILVHRLEGKRPALGAGGVAATVAGYLFWSVAILAYGWWRSDGQWPIGASAWPGLAWPTIAVAAFALLAWTKTRRVSGHAAAEKLMRYGAMWQGLYATAWMCALGRWREAAMLAGVAAGGFVAMTALKELAALVATPVGYRTR